VLLLSSILDQRLYSNYMHSSTPRTHHCLPAMGGPSILPETSLGGWVSDRERRRGVLLTLIKTTLWVAKFLLIGALIDDP
jgi:hypothetical protein